MRGHHVPGSVSLMPRVVQGRGAGVIVVVAGLVCGHLLAQDTPPVSISPSNATIVVGETRSFRAVDKNERMLHDVHWTASEPAVLDLAPDDEVEITAKQVGRCTVTAHASQGFADAHGEVVGGAALPQGTVKWSAADFPHATPPRSFLRCHRPTDPMFSSTAPAPTAPMCGLSPPRASCVGAGRLVPRPAAPSPRGKPLAPPASINTHAPSICDSISAGRKGTLSVTGSRRTISPLPLDRRRACGRSRKRERSASSGSLIPK